MYDFEDMKNEEKNDNLEEFYINEMVGKIRAYRIHQGISQRELSRMSGVTQNIISRMENGTRIPQFQTLVKLIDALDLELTMSIKPKSKK